MKKNNKSKAIDGEKSVCNPEEKQNEFEKNEETIIKNRRKALNDKSFDLNSPYIGLALSGGGIRSATFCLGVLRGLAKNGVLRHFDYLSTVSGGGYIGSALGRMYQKFKNVDAVEKALQDNQSEEVRWLRHNGRYLTPSGSKDWSILFSVYLRSWLAIQWEYFILVSFFCSLMIFPHLLGIELFYYLPTREIQYSFETFIKSPWLVLGIIIFSVGFPWYLVKYFQSSYVFFRKKSAKENKKIHQSINIKRLTDYFLIILLFFSFLYLLIYLDKTIILFQISLKFFKDSFEISIQLKTLISAILVMMFLSALFANIWMHLYGFWSVTPDKDINKFRYKQTKGLRNTIVSTGVLLLIGILDWLSWELWKIMRDFNFNFGITSFLGVSITILTSSRIAIEYFSQQSKTARGGLVGRFKGIFLNFFSALSVFISTLAYATLVQWAIFSPDFIQSLMWTTWIIILGVALIWICRFGSNSQWINDTSLHPFYRARLTRAYLGAANEKRFSEGEGENFKRQYKSVDQVADGDDIEIEEYKPDIYGGPLHLINLCLNETKNSTPGKHGVNLDRKACPVTISSYFVEVNRKISKFRKDIHQGSLAQWISVSGAAASSGAGARTNRGWSSLVYLFGARLGYWALQFKEKQSANESQLIIWNYLPKLAMQWSELTANYDTAAPYCLLSDGGHFENTGVYPLISRKLPFIILVDCGADPQYRFTDLQELIRRTRIDHQVEITFYSRGEAAKLFPNSKQISLEILSPEEMSDNRSTRGVMLARIRYPDESFGTLLIIKPNLHEYLPLDIKVYARENSVFPQQPTADQFFDEAQWESYQRLGFDFGNQLTHQWLSSLPNWTKYKMPAHPKGRLDAILLEDFTRLDNKIKASWHIASSSAVGAGLGAGAILAVMIPLLQTLNDYQKNEEYKEVARYRSKIESTTNDLEIIKNIFKAENSSLDSPVVLELETALDLKKSFTSKKIPPILENETRNALEHLEKYCQLLSLKKADLREATLKVKNFDSADNYCGDFTKKSEKIIENPYWSYKKPYKEVTTEKTILRYEPSPKPLGTADISLTPSIQTHDDLLIGTRSACLSSGILVRLYPQVYEDKSLPKIEELKKEVDKIVDIQPTENVVASARLTGRKQPYCWSHPIFIFHSSDQADCADKLAEIYKKINSDITDVTTRLLPASLKGTPGVIEFWLPPDSGFCES
ncbi:MAG: patatin-like phospholipase family protein [Candidatus Contendobacter sp.]